MLALSVIRPVCWAAAGLAVAGLAVAGCTVARSADPASQSAVSLTGTSLSRPGSVAGPGSLPPASDLSAAQIARFRWSGLPVSPLGPQYRPLVTWAGGELYEFASDTGAAAVFTPATGRWRRIAAPPRGIGSGDAVAVWTGSRLLVTSGGAVCSGSRETADCWVHYVALYDPSANRWSVASLPAQLVGLALSAVVWTGHDIVVTGVGNRGLAVAAYAPATGRWQVITPAVPAGHKVDPVAMVATPGRVILWLLWDRVTAISPHGSSDARGVDVLALTGNGTWRNVTGHWPQGQMVTSPLFTGSAILVSPSQTWCGSLCMAVPGWTPGYFADPATLRRTVIPSGLLASAGPAFVWTGHAIIVIALGDSVPGVPGVPGQPRVHGGDMMLWDLASSRWLQLPSPPGYSAASFTLSAQVWTGSQMLVLTGTGQLLTFHH